MKRIKLFALCVIFAGGFALTSCGDDENDNAGAGNVEPVDPVTPDAKDAMSPADQKEYMETVALKFMDMMPSSDFRDLGYLGRYVYDTYGEDYDWDNVDTWADDILDDVTESLGSHKEYGDYYNDYKAVVMASNFTGNHFTAKNGKWILEKTKDDLLRFTFTDKNDMECVLTVQTSGAEKKVHAFDLDDWIKYDYSSGSYNDYYDRTQYTLAVPENIVVTLTQNGSQVVKVTTKIDLGNISGEEFDLSKNDLTFSTLIELNNGYTFNLSQVAYTANKNASVSFTMSKKGTNMVVVAVTSDINDIPSCNISAFSSPDFDIDDYDTDNSTAKNAFVKVDILGQIQMQGRISDVHKFVDYMNEAEDNEYNERTYKSYINQANGLTDINLFYDGSAVKQATVKLEPFEDKDWQGSAFWDVDPILQFFDGSQYSTFEAFFNETDFKKVIDTFKTLSNKYANLVDEEIDW